MEITSLALTRLGISSKIQFFENILSVVNANDPALLKVENKYAALRSKWQELSSLYIVDAKNPLSQEISDLDVQRDEIIFSLWFLAQGHSHSPIEVKRHAGEKILRNLSLYANSPGAFGKQKFDVETNNITNLLSGWNTDTELSSAAELLGLSDITTVLEEINALHNSKFLERNSMYAAETTDTSVQQQSEASIVYHDLCKALNSMAYLTPSALYDKTINEINALIESTVISLKQSKARKKEKPAENV